MPIDIIRNLLFIHIPKTGGSSVESALNLHPNQVDDAHEFLSGTKDHLQHLTFSEISDRLEYDVVLKCKPFCIIRNPLHRFYSEYKWRVKIKHPIVADKSIAEFAEYLYMRKLNNTLKNECHFRFQSDYFFNDVGAIDTIKVFKLEDGMDKVEDWLLAECDISVRIPHINKDTSKASDCSDYVDGLVKEIYKEDAIKLGYVL